MPLLIKNALIFDKSLSELQAQKLLINTINAHSYNVAQKDGEFAESLTKCDVLIPDGVGIVMAVRLLKGEKIRKIAGHDLFLYEMNALNKKGGTCFFLGSSESVLSKIKIKAAREYPNIKIVTYSPPYKLEFTEKENMDMIAAVNVAKPDLLWIGMTAPKQEKWAYKYVNELEVNGHIGCIGAVFDFYAGTVERAPRWMITIGMEWFYRLAKEPKRMWRRYLIGNTVFIWNVLKEKIG